MSKQTTERLIPEGWTKAHLNDILILEYGRHLIDIERLGGSYAVWGSNGVVGFHSEFLVEGPIIIIGRKGAVGTVHFSNENCWPIDTTYYIKPLNSTVLRFIYFLLQRLNLRNLDKSTTIPGLNRDNIYSLSFLLPPIQEQLRIVSKIDELFSELDKSVEGLNKALKQLEVYKYAVLKTAFEGKLSEKWRKENKVESSQTVFKSLEIIRENVFQEKLKAWNKLKKSKSKSKKLISQPRRSEVPELFNKDEIKSLPKIPSKWKWVKVGHVADIQMGQSPPGESYNFKKNGVPLINGPVEFGPKPFSKTLLSKWTTSPMKMCLENDLILCVRGSTTGRQNIAGFASCIGRGVAAIKTFLPTQMFLNYYFHYSERKIYSLGTGSTFPSISIEQISNFPIPLCTIEEQNRIISELEFRYTLIENLQETIQKYLRRIESFRQIVFKKAFDGNLVEQNNSDEPADILLARIQAEKMTYLTSQKSKMKDKPKKIKTPIQPQLSILDILKNSSEPILAKDLWQQSKHKDNIEEFYEELKSIRINVKEVKNQTSSLLSFKK